MSQVKELPKGIKALRRFKVDTGAPVRPHRFERLIDRLNLCAGNHNKAIRCDRCPYLNECLERFDSLCGRVAMARGQRRAIARDGNETQANTESKAVDRGLRPLRPAQAGR